MPKGPSKSTVIIQQLLEERRQYEAWIARLNDSADATPGHVRARVRSDYEARLAAVTAPREAGEGGGGGRAGVHQVRDGGRSVGAIGAARQRRAIPAVDPG